MIMVLRNSIAPFLICFCLQDGTIVKDHSSYHSYDLLFGGWLYTFIRYVTFSALISLLSMKFIFPQKNKLVLFLLKLKKKLLTH